MAFTYTVTGNEQAHESNPIPPVGEYDVKIVECNEKVSQAGNDMLELVCQLKGDIQYRVWEYIVSGNEFAPARIREILESIGKYTPGMKVTAATFRNAEGRLKIKHETKDGKTRARVNYWIKGEPKQTKIDDKDIEEIPF